MWSTPRSPRSRSRKSRPCIKNTLKIQDLGEEQSTKLNLASNFPWLLTNVTLVNGEQIAATKPYHIIEHGDYKVGLISIAEIEWVSTLSAFDEEDIHFEDIVECSEKWSKILSKLFFS